MVISMLPIVNNRIRKISNGTIITAVGTGEEGYSGDRGAATSASLYTPYAIAVDSSGTIYLADTFNQRIRNVR